MSKRTIKVGLVGKYGTRYGSSIRKQIKKIEISQHKRYLCNFCGKKVIKRISVGIWYCRKCNKTFAGGAWELQTEAGFISNNVIKKTSKNV
mmetsp:Transcript_6559/g.14976  ORF Transcript_6559/g.14976 Transcript_6559/m.14976 type:complete len:91 (+) Transcript_6559:54-326(+)